MTLTDVVPNLIVAEIARSADFYRDVLGFSIVATVPEAAPHVFVWLQRDAVSVFLNSPSGVEQDLPSLRSRPIGGGTATLFITIEAQDGDRGVDEMYESVRERSRIVMPLKDQFYGMREFAIEDPDGYVVIFAQRIAG